MVKLNKNDPERVKARRLAAAHRMVLRDERTPQQQLDLILARGAKETNREVIRLRNQIAGE